MTKGERFGLGAVAAMFLAQVALIRFDAGFWLLVAPAVPAALLGAISNLRHEHAKVERPGLAYVIGAVFASLVGAFFWLAPEGMSFKLQMSRAIILDVAILWFAVIASAHMRGRKASA